MTVPRMLPAWAVSVARDGGVVCASARLDLPQNEGPGDGKSGETPAQQIFGSHRFTPETPAGA